MKFSPVLLWAPVVFFVAIISLQIFGPVPIGIADNGDFARVLGSYGIWEADLEPGASNSGFIYYVPEYKITDEKWESGVPSTESLLVPAAKLISKKVIGRRRFDLRALGAVHLILFAGAFFCAGWALRGRSVRVRLAAIAVLFWIWTDVSYVQQLSTAYTDAGADMMLCILFAITLVLLLRNGTYAAAWVFGFIGAGCFLLGEKLQHAPDMVPLSVLALIFAATHRRVRILWFVAPVLMLATALVLNARTPARYRTAPSFTVVFYKLAVLSSEPNKVLAAFGMPVDEFGKYIGHYYYEAIVPHRNSVFDERIRSLVTPGKLVSFYLSNPGIAWKVLKSDWIESASDVNLGLYGDLREIDVKNGRQTPEFNLWSGARQRLFRVFPVYPLIFFVFSLALFGAGLFGAAVRARFPLWCLPGMMTVIAIATFFSSSLLDAVETSRHMVLFQVSTDLTIFSAIFALVLRNDREPSFPAQLPESKGV
jgi:hypothetical protein